MANSKYHPVDSDAHPLTVPSVPDQIELEKQHVREMMQRYRNVFGTDDGRLVLGDILTLCHIGETLDPKDPVQVSEYNVGLTILRMAGALDPFYFQLGIGR
jgi:hypothetical protein